MKTCAFFRSSLKCGAVFFLNFCGRRGSGGDGGGGNGWLVVMVAYVARVAVNIVRLGHKQSTYLLSD